MNIFYISHDPEEAAKWMVDKHVVKMIVESAQLLSTAHRFLDHSVIYTGKTDGKKRNVTRYILPDERENILYHATHVNHPSAIWTRASVENYLWLVEHTYALLNEYMYRYEKKHKTQDIMYYLQSPPHNLRDYDWTPMPSAMAEQYIVSDDPLTNYRNYYKLGKINLHKWTKREPPEWLYE